ncbi:MAG: Crp/Fnr family transcriptional regulator [Ferruginibacter sp.]
MTYTLLLNNFSKHISLTGQEEERIVSLLKNRKLKRRQFLFQEGNINQHAAFIVKGCLRSYSIDKNGFEHILQFAPPGWWIGDMHSFITQQPGTLFIDAVDDSEIVMLLKSDLEMLYTSIPKLERFFRIIAENALAAYQHRLIGNLGLSAMERYDNFCRLYPSLIECLPQKQVAAYIGVTPEFLSKMLNRLAVMK